MDKTKYSAIDLHQHSKYSYEAPKATLLVKDILQYYRQLGETKFERVNVDGKEVLINKKVAFSITDHDSSEGAYYAWKQINKEPEKYTNVDFIPGIELNVDCGRVLTYPDEANNDEKYVFKGMHLLAHAKPGKEKEFFKRTIAISLLNKMVIDPNTLIYNQKILAKTKEEKQTTFISIGGQILAARNLIFEKFNVKIPYDCYLPCIKEGASYTEIRNIFIDETYNYIKSHSNYFNELSVQQAKNQISKIITKKDIKGNQPYIVFPSTPQIISDLHSLNKIDILEIPKILGDCATTCFAHPYTLKIHKNTKIAVKDFLNVDISMLPDNVKNIIKSKLNNEQELKNGYFSTADIMVDAGHKKYYVNGDKLNLVAFQIMYNNLLKKGVKIDGYEIQDYSNKNNLLETVLNVAMDKYNFAISYGTDSHFNKDDEYYFKDKPIENNNKKSYFDHRKMYCTQSSYFKLNRSGKSELSQEENSVSFSL